MVAPTCYPSTGDAEGVESQFQSTHGLSIRISQKRQNRSNKDLNACTIIFLILHPKEKVMMLIKFQRQLETVKDMHNPEHETVSDTQKSHTELYKSIYISKVKCFI